MSNTIRETLNLPQTDFPMRAGLPKREPEWLAHWQKEDLYTKLREKSKREGRKPFILHCGPPYANGSFHTGHALDFSLKDFVVRSKQMAGFDAVYVPGWDCHGLPIEWKVEEGFKAKGKNKEDFSVKEIRDMCREFAQHWVNVQIENCQRFGAMADFANPYITMNPKNEAGIVRELGRMSQHGLVYKGAKSVMWSTVEETSLAEAEVEYADKESLAIYVKFMVEGKDNEAVVIWTTTPWTMPANKAVAYNADTDYVLLQATEVFEKATAKVGDKVWVAKSLVEDFTKMVGFTAYQQIAEQKGSAFKGVVLKHPFYDMTVPLLEGHHVTEDGGTGFVHIAPSHGADDFIIGQQFGLDLLCHVNGDGSYDEKVEALPATKIELAGKVIWDAQKAIIAEMTEQNTLMRWYKFKHSYPVSWRSKAPLIFRTTPQWYVALDKPLAEGKTVRQKALEEIAEIGQKGGWVPTYGQNRITAMMQGRPDWCISRQRAWGVPITIMQHKPTGAYTFEMEVFEHIAQLIEKDSIDVWETLPIEQLLPEGYLECKGWQAADMVKETDILDVWFDSGTTYAHVVEEQMKQTLPADLYLEGSDQHRGWFNSSLTACTATRGIAPYKKVITHGFVVDGEGKKMSKSIGNIVASSDAVNQYGMDVLRLWVAGSDYSEDVRYSEEIMKGASDSYRRFRNTFRFLLGNLYDFNEQEHAVNYNDMPELEKWVLHKLHITLEDVQKNYDSYQFRRVFELLHNFCSKELSNLYFDIRKDSLYCDPRVKTAEGEVYYNRRRACQTVLNVLLKGLTTHLAPIMPFTTDEVWRSAYGEDKELHLEDFMPLDDVWVNAELDNTFSNVWGVRDTVNLKMETLRSEGLVRSNLEAKVQLQNMHSMVAEQWADLLVVSIVETGDEITVSSLLNDENYIKCARSWKYVPKTEAVEIEDGVFVTKRDAIALNANKKEKDAA